MDRISESITLGLDWLGTFLNHCGVFDGFVHQCSGEMSSRPRLQKHCRRQGSGLRGVWVQGEVTQNARRPGRQSLYNNRDREAKLPSHRE